MPDLVLSTALLESLAQDRGADRRIWVDGLVEVVADLAQRWDLRLDAPFQPGGNNSWVAPARDAADRDLVLKVGWTHDEGRDEGAGLRAWGGHGAVGLHAEHVHGPTTTLLLDRCRPGTELRTALPVAEQDPIVARVLRELWTAPTDGHPFRQLAQMCAWWADASAAALERRPDLLDPGLARAGLALFRELPDTATETRLLATDLHAGNLLADTTGPGDGPAWRLIDPKPYVGDPAYDVQQHLLNDVARVTADPLGVSGRLADLAGLDRDRVLAWLFARAVQEAPFELGTAPLARALAATGRF